MAKIYARDLDNSSAYTLLTGVVVPRPIAWISTQSSVGKSNIAPFSCFTFVSSDPPMIGFNCGLRDGARKDTARNIAETGEFVVNIVDDGFLEKVHQSAADYSADVSELDVLELDRAPSDTIAVPRVISCPINLECTLDQIVKFGHSGSEFFVGEIKLFHVRDGLLADGKVDSESLRPLGRLAGPVYGKLGEVVRATKT
ncbi:flavin reductase family protein [Xanthobacter dioxanivorans]|uniref:Flavin reductase family protein n=1 Tax=Xanthobacter dioxanivorans TaxID=2528964 RepID=A0A974SJJ6_9HYPH|nr:flavin reductase family protein [Xanthobacter dioxanivorans]QRG08471.1 flavin reductase family protein [Xanthobacter dioxanivorans]